MTKVTLDAFTAIVESRASDVDTKTAEEIRECLAMREQCLRLERRIPIPQW